MTLASDANADSWTRYWREGHKDTCFLQGSAFSLADLWRGFFTELPEGSRVLDLATGNGAVAIIAADVSSQQQKNFEIHGIDQADIEPGIAIEEAPASISLCRFHGNARIEELPFGDEQFSGISSQFGFEYSNTRRTTTEVARICCQGARVRLVMHALDGGIHKSSMARLARIREITSEGHVLQRAQTIARLAGGSSRANSQKIDMVRAKFMRKLKATHSKFKDAPQDDVALLAMSYIGNRVHRYQAHDPKELRESMVEASRELRAYAIRLNAMINASHDAKAMDQVVDYFDEAGFSQVGYKPIEDNYTVIAWQLDATK
jgi:ubiquinone/menaquinone biosynthesis C-methylase UbiE